MIMDGFSIVGMIVYGVMIALLITLPVLVIIVVIGAIRRSVTPHQKEVQRLLGQLVDLLEENNLLLNQQNYSKRPDGNRDEKNTLG